MRPIPPPEKMSHVGSLPFLFHAAAYRIRSFCIAMDEPECHYSYRLPAHAKNSSSEAASRREREGVAHAASTPSPPTGQTRLQKGEERAAEGDRREADHMVLPLKRCGRQNTVFFVCCAGS